MKLLFALSSLFSFAILLAQPTISESYAPVAGTIWTEYSTDETDGMNNGPSGPNQTWTYTNFTEEFESEPLEFLAPASLPAGFDGMFPDAEMAFYYEEDSTAQFLLSESTGFYLDGFATLSEEVPPPNNQQDFEPNLTFVPLGFTYVDDRFEVAKTEVFIEGDFPLLLRSSILTDMVADGYGTITTPAGTYSDVLRIRMFQYRIDSVFVDTNMDGIYEFIDTDGPSDTTINYHHLQNAEPLLIATIEMNSTESEMIGFNYIVSGAVGIEENEAKADLTIYPNPASDYLQISSSSDVEWKEYAILDLTGKIVAQNGLGSQEKLIDVSGLNEGLYLLQLTSDSTVRTRRFYVSH